MSLDHSFSAYARALFSPSDVVRHYLAYVGISMIPVALLIFYDWTIIPLRLLLAIVNESIFQDTVIKVLPVASWVLAVLVAASIAYRLYWTSSAVKIDVDGHARDYGIEREKVMSEVRHTVDGTGLHVVPYNNGYSVHLPDYYMAGIVAAGSLIVTMIRY